VLSQDQQEVPEQFFEMIIFFLVASCCDIPFITDPSMTKARALRDDLLTWLVSLGVTGLKLIPN
jgi:hypothetical protein